MLVSFKKKFCITSGSIKNKISLERVSSPPWEAVAILKINVEVPKACANGALRTRILSATNPVGSKHLICMGSTDDDIGMIKRFG